MRFFEALRYPFRGPHVFLNLGCIFVCMLIPVAGVMVITGYTIIAEKILIANPDADPPRFDFGKFGHYLQRGLAPFVVSLIASLAMAVVWIPLSLAIFFSVLFLHESHPAAMIVVIVLAACAGIILIIAATCAMAPLMFKAGMDGKIIEAFDKKFLREYWRRVGLAQLGAQLWMMAVLFPIALVALCLPLIGPYAAMSYFFQVQAHVMAQLYLLYLQRGGPPLAIALEPYETGGFPVEPMRLPPPLPIAHESERPDN